MSAVSIQRSAALSCIIHLTLLCVVLVAMRHSRNFLMPAPYIVSLVSPEAFARTALKKPVSTAPAESPPEQAGAPVQTRSVEVEDRYLSDKIAAIEAKKRIERIVQLRGVVSLKGGKPEARPAPSLSAERPLPGIPGSYTDRITQEIRDHWTYPDTGDRSIEAIVSIRILKNGSLQIMGIEKSSGYPLFDRSALRAITKASPVTPPPDEMDIGVRFYL